MSMRNAQLVIGYAAHYDKFRNALRHSPNDALKEFSSELQLSPEGCTDEEMSAVLSFTDDDYSSFQQLMGRFSGGIGEQDRTSLKIT